MIDALSSNVNLNVTVLPSKLDCRLCMDMAESYNAVPDCKNCHIKRRVKILQFVKNFFDTYAVVINDKGLIEEIPTRLIKTDILEGTQDG